MSETWPEDRMDVIGSNGPTGDHYMTTEEEEMPTKITWPSGPAPSIDVTADSWRELAEQNKRPGRSDGSTASYYELPLDAEELQDLISYRNMNSQDGEIFRAIYRKGRASHSDELRDAKKVLFYANAEVERLERYGR